MQGNTIATGRRVKREGREPDALHRLRQLLLSLLVFSIAGTVVELFLLGHTESVWQWMPIVLLGIGMIATIAVLVKPGWASITSLRAIMLFFVASGLVGLYLHYRGNVEFELEMRPGLHGLDLFRRAISGATPSLAPGTMTQFGLLGLALTYRHPSMRRSDGPSPQPENS
jgi:hypothetical protein